MIMRPEKNKYPRMPGTPLWKCPECKKNYQKKAQCQVHIDKVHTKVKK